MCFSSKDKKDKKKNKKVVKEASPRRASHLNAKELKEVSTTLDAVFVQHESINKRPEIRPRAPSALSERSEVIVVKHIELDEPSIIPANESGSGGKVEEKHRRHSGTYDTASISNRSQKSVRSHKSGHSQKSHQSSRHSYVSHDHVHVESDESDSNDEHHSTISHGSFSTVQPPKQAQNVSLLNDIFGTMNPNQVQESVHGSVHTSRHGSVHANHHESHNGSVHQSHNGSAHQSRNGSVHQSRNGSVHQSRRTSLHSNHIYHQMGSAIHRDEVTHSHGGSVHESHHQNCSEETIIVNNVITHHHHDEGICDEVVQQIEIIESGKHSDHHNEGEERVYIGIHYPDNEKIQYELQTAVSLPVIGAGVTVSEPGDYAEDVGHLESIQGEFDHHEAGSEHHHEHVESEHHHEHVESEHHHEHVEPEHVEPEHVEPEHVESGYHHEHVESEYHHEHVESEHHHNHEHVEPEYHHNHEHVEPEHHHHHEHVEPEHHHHHEHVESEHHHEHVEPEHHHEVEHIHHEATHIHHNGDDESVHHEEVVHVGVLDQDIYPAHPHTHRFHINEANCIDCSLPLPSGVAYVGEEIVGGPELMNNVSDLLRGVKNLVYDHSDNGANDDTRSRLHSTNDQELSFNKIILVSNKGKSTIAPSHRDSLTVDNTVVKTRTNTVDSILSSSSSSSSSSSTGSLTSESTRHTVTKSKAGSTHYYGADVKINDIVVNPGDILVVDNHSSRHTSKTASKATSKNTTAVSSRRESRHTPALDQEIVVGKVSISSKTSTLKNEPTHDKHHHDHHTSDITSSSSSSLSSKRTSRRESVVGKASGITTRTQSPKSHYTAEIDSDILSSRRNTNPSIKSGHKHRHHHRESSASRHDTEHHTSRSRTLTQESEAVRSHVTVPIGSIATSKTGSVAHHGHHVNTHSRKSIEELKRELYKSAGHSSVHVDQEPEKHSHGEHHHTEKHSHGEHHHTEKHSHHHDSIANGQTDFLNGDGVDLLVKSKVGKAKGQSVKSGLSIDSAYSYGYPSRKINFDNLTSEVSEITDYQLKNHATFIEKSHDYLLFNVSTKRTICKYSSIKKVVVGGEQKKSVKDKKIILFGTKSSGKSELVNSICNKIYGVGKEHNFRFVVDSPEHLAHTSEIIAYEFNNTTLGYKLTIIDTPGVSLDANEHAFSYKKLYEDYLKKYIEASGRLLINGVCIVIKNEDNFWQAPFYKQICGLRRIFCGRYENRTLYPVITNAIPFAKLNFLDDEKNVFQPKVTKGDFSTKRRANWFTTIFKFTSNSYISSMNGDVKHAILSNMYKFNETEAQLNRFFNVLEDEALPVLLKRKERH